MRRECPRTGTTGSWVLPHLNTEKKFQVPSKRCPPALDSRSNTSFSSVEGHLKCCNTSRTHFLKRLTNHWKHYSNTTKIPRPLRPIGPYIPIWWWWWWWWWYLRQFHWGWNLANKIFKKPCSWRWIPGPHHGGDGWRREFLWMNPFKGNWNFFNKNTP